MLVRMTTFIRRFKMRKNQLMLGAALLCASVSHADTVSATVYFTDQDNHSPPLGGEGARMAC